MSKYNVIEDGELLQVPYTWVIGCCDCGLVHTLKFSRRGNKLFVRVFRDNRRTAAKRRSKGIKIVRKVK